MITKFKPGDIIKYTSLANEYFIVVNIKKEVYILFSLARICYEPYSKGIDLDPENKNY